MKPELARFESAQAEKMKVVKIDLSKPNRAAMDAYGHAWKQGGIPFTVLLDGDGKVVASRRGFMSAADLTREFASRVP